VLQSARSELSRVTRNTPSSRVRAHFLHASTSVRPNRVAAVVRVRAQRVLQTKHVAAASSANSDIRWSTSCRSAADPPPKGHHGTDGPHTSPADDRRTRGWPRSSQRSLGTVTFTDRSFACGTALGEARNGETVPALFLGPVPPSLVCIASRSGRRRHAVRDGVSRSGTGAIGGIWCGARHRIGRSSARSRRRRRNHAISRRPEPTAPFGALHLALSRRRIPSEQRCAGAPELHGTSMTHDKRETPTACDKG